MIHAACSVPLPRCQRRLWFSLPGVPEPTAIPAIGILTPLVLPHSKPPTTFRALVLVYPCCYHMVMKTKLEKAADMRLWRKNHKHPCSECENIIGHQYTLCLSCATTGSRNSLWKGDDATDDAGRQRARRIYDNLRGGPCDDCHEAPSLDVHHVDNNPLNNDRSNIAMLCRRCHMTRDSRLAAFAKQSQYAATQPRTPVMHLRQALRSSINFLEPGT